MTETRYDRLEAAVPMIECRDVHKYYGEYHALRGIDLTIRAGEFFSLLGPSGCGKTTLLRTIAGFEDISSGVVLIDDKDMAGVAANHRPTNMVFQSYAIFPHLSVAENVGLGLRPDLRLSRTEHAAVAQALQEVGLQDMAARRPAQLSGGQQSRVALARVALRARPVLLLDEAFAALGPALKSDMLALLARIADRNGATVLMVTHDPDDARAFACQTVAVIAGRAHPPVPTGPLLDDPPPELAAYLG